MRKQALRAENYFKAETRSRGRRLPGFTIVELLIVIVVIGILAAISIVAYNGIQNRATDSGTKSDTNLVAKGIESYYAINGSYAPDLASNFSGSDSSASMPDSDTTFMYTLTSDGYELTGSSDRNGSKQYCISSTSRSVTEGACPGHMSTADSCFTFNSSTGTITGYSNNTECPKVVIIPKEIGGRAVTSIGTNAFLSKQLTSVTIPNSVTSIGTAAFWNNQLTSVTIPNSVTSIEQAAFQNNQLTSVTIPNSVTSIGHGVFQSNQLTSVTIPNSVTSIEDYAFRINQLTSVTIPNSVTSIGSHAFSYNQLTSVTIPNSMTSIGGAAFYDNSNITCHIPNSAPYNPLSPNIFCSSIERY